MKITHLCWMVFCSTILSGCMTQRVLVVDSSNRPVAGAAVQPISLSMNYPALTTGEQGKVSLPHAVQKVEWVSVTKQGFKPSGSVPVREENPLVVTLTPVK